MTSRLFVTLQYLLPRYWMTALVYRLARVRWRPLKNALVRGFVRAFDVDTDEAAGDVPGDYATFNDFFTRELRDGARAIDTAPRALVSPVDGTVSEAGPITRGTLLQAKGHRYSLHDLLATDLEDADSFEDGAFMTIYLAPYNYHRIHAPLAGHVSALRYVPGDLFSVNRATVENLHDLFARNERLVCHLDTNVGPVVLLFVGALNVGSISTPWTGEIRPRRRGVVEQIDLARTRHPTGVAKGDLLGWFNMGSTVIVLLPRGAATLNDDVVAGRRVRMGESLATLRGLSA